MHQSHYISTGYEDFAIRSSGFAGFYFNTVFEAFRVLANVNIVSILTGIILLFNGPY